MLTPIELTFEAVGRFVEPQTIYFNKIEDLTQLDAINNNTGGSSGSGKTTLAHIIEYNLGINSLPVSILQSRLTKKQIYTLGKYDNDGTLVIVERGKSKFSVTIGNEVFSGSSKLTEEALDRVIGMSRDLFKKILHKAQGSRGFFLEFAPSEVHKFLTSCLGLDREQTKIVTLDNKLKALTDQETSLKSVVESNKSALEATQSAISSLGLPPVLETTPEAIQALKDAHSEAIGNLELIKQAHKKELEELELTRPVITTTPFDRSNIERLENEIVNIITEIAKFEKIELDRQSQVKAKISELQIAIGNLNNQELTRQSEVRNQISATKAEISKIQGAELARQSIVKNQISALQVESIKTKVKVDQGATSRQEASILAKELQKVRSSICPTCNQGWITEACKLKESQILASISGHKKAVMAGNEAQNQIISINDQIQLLAAQSQSAVTLEIDLLNAKIYELGKEGMPRLVPEVVELSSQVERLKEDVKPRSSPELNKFYASRSHKEVELSNIRQEELGHQFKENAKKQLMVDQFALKQTKLRKEHETILQFVYGEETKALAIYEAAKYKVRSFEESKKRFEESLYALNSQSNAYGIQLEKKILELTSVQEEMDLATELKAAIKSYLSCSFEDALDSIGDQATKLIRSIPNMSTATIAFEGLKETVSTGKIKEEINCIISTDGEIGVPIKSLSGGERSSTDLAIDLAVVKFIEERTGKGIDLMILDEPFTGLDTANVLEALEMLKESNVDKRLLIVDHNQIASQSIESKITVVRDGLTSKIVQQ